MTYTDANFTGDADLREMETLAIDAQAELGPNFECAVGDVDWRMFRATTVRPEENIRLWRDGRGVLIGFAWFTTKGYLDLVVHPRTWCAAIVPEMLAWAEARSQEPGATERADQTLVAWALESNAPLTRALCDRGYGKNGHAYLHLWRSLESELPSPALASGYSVRSITGAEEAAARADLHRAAFPHSRNSAEMYGRLMAARHYQRELDIVVLGPGGEFVSMALAWFDARNKTGEFEPVGTHPAHREKGLASAAIREGLRRLRERGARAAIVCAEADNPASVELYQRLGFAVIDRNLGFAPPKKDDAKRRPATGC